LKTLLIYGLLVFVLFFYLNPIEAVAIPADQVAVLIKSWAIPMTSNQNSSFALTSSFSGNEIYYVDSDSNKIGRLVPETNTITEWDIPTANSFPISIAYHPSGNVYFIEGNSNKIGRLVPETNTITEWTIQSNSSSGLSAGNNSGIGNNTTQSAALAVDSSTGNVYFIEGNSNKIGRLVPETNTITEWTIQSNSSSGLSAGNNSGIGNNTTQSAALAVDSSTGNVYFIEGNSNKIGRLVPETNTITEWTIQSNSTNIKSMALGFAGNEEIYYVDSDSNKIGRIAPATNLVTEWDIPTANSFPTSVKFDRATGNVYFLESNSNTIGRLGPFSSQITEWKLPEKPFDIEVDSAGSIHYIDVKGTKIVRMD
jgi:streptogramin lyase